MKKIVFLFGIVGLITTYSCSSTNKTGNNAADDVYYSTKDQQPLPPSSPSNNSATIDNNYNPSNSGNYQTDNSNQNQQDDYAPSGENSVSSRSSDDNGNTYVTNNYNGDYYDYEYSSRIRRFYNPVYGYNYYDPYYTNSYLYDYNPSSWGVSIYLGYNWWAPSSFYYDPFCYGGYSVGYGYNPYWGYQPYSHCGSYYNSYFSGYNQGYWNGYHDGFYGGNSNPYYYNSYDATSFYYGPRGAVSNNSPRFSSQRQSSIAPISTKYEQAISEGRISDRSKSDISNPGRQNSGMGKNASQIFREKNSDNQSETEKINIDRESNKENRNNSPTKRSIDQEINPSIKNQNINNTSRNNTRERNSILETLPKKENFKTKKESQNSSPDNSKINQSSKQVESTRRKQQSRTETPSRQENNTPVFTPRVAPRQFKQENVTSPQRSQPSRPVEQNNNYSGGRKK